MELKLLAICEEEWSNLHIKIGGMYMKFNEDEESMFRSPPTKLHAETETITYII